MLDLIGGFGGGSLIDSYFAMTAVLLAILAAGGALSALLRTRAEEQSARADTLLSTPLSRRDWLASHLTVPVITSVTILLAGGVGTGLAHLPAVWLLLGIGMVLVGVLPRMTTFVWILFAGCAVTTILGPTLRLPDSVMTLSPFEHTPRLPGPLETGATDAAVLLTALAVTLVGGGFAGFRRRDIG